ncbi:MAG: hypothetical protein ABIE36_02005, partial [Candidatus Diapherotrites archaeon]
TINLRGVISIVKDLESIGDPFSITTKREINEMNSFTDTPEFKELANPIPLASTLEHYLRQAKIDISLSRREDNFTQYLGVTYGKPAKIKIITDLDDSEKEFKRSILPCHFYLIKDKI